MDGKTDLHLLRDVNLDNFNAVMAFSGWPDAKRVATYAAEYLQDKLRAEKIGEIDSNLYNHFTIQRPLISIKNGLVKSYAPPSNELYMAKGDPSGHDLLILIGTEPHLNWARYVESVFEAFSLGKANRVLLFGGLIDRIPHTVEPLISGVANAPELVEELKHNGIEPIDYLGPCSIHSLILRDCEAKSIPAMSIWGHTPEYVTGVDPSTAHQLLCKAKALMGVEVDLEELRMEGSLFQKQLNSMMKQDREFAQLVQKLEIEYKDAKRNLDYFT